MILLSTILLALGAIIIPTLAQTVEFTNTDFTDITPGENFLVTWSGDGDVRLDLSFPQTPFPIANTTPKI
jgi:hypothetical protein